MAGELQSFIFGPGTDNLSYEQLKRRQAIATAMAGQKRPFPKTLGEGMTALGEAVGGRLEENRLAEAEKRFAAGRAGLAVGAPGIAVAPPGPRPALPPAPGARPPPAATMPVAPAAPGRTDATDVPPLPDNLAANDGSDDATSRIAMALMQQQDGSSPVASGGPPANPTVAGPQAPQQSTELVPPPGGPATDDPVTGRRNAIGGIESDGARDPYQAVGTPTRSGDRAFGRYQVMGNNIPQWTQAALGQSLTPQEFLASKEAQDAVFDHRFGGYVDKYGEEGAARAWYGGEKGMHNLNATDIHGRLTVGGYGQDYMRRRGGEPGNERRVQVASNDPNFSAARVGEEENPPTPTDIKPMMMAQAQAAPSGVRAQAPAAGAGIPGPLATPVEYPPAPTVGRTTIPDKFTRPPQEPKPPELQPMTPHEAYGYKLLQHPLYGSDPATQALAKQYIEFGAGQRKQTYERDVEVYKGELSRYEKSALAYEEAFRNKPKTELELRKMEEEAADRGRKEQREAHLGGIKPEVYEKNIEKSYEGVKGMSAAAQSIANARRALLDDKMFTGLGAEQALSIAKFKAAMGFPTDPRIKATESFKSFASPLIAQARQSLAGGANISDKDMQMAEKAAAGDVRLDRTSIEEVLGALERINTINAVEHQKKVLTYAGADPNRRQQLFGAFGVPNIEGVVPEEAVRLLRTNRDDPKVHQQFDETFHTPGLARRVLQFRGR